MATELIEKLVYRVARDTPPRGGAVRVLLDQNGTVTTTRGLLDVLFTQVFEYHVVENTTVSGEIELGPLVLQDSGSGQRAHLMISLSGVRVARGKAAQLASLLFDRTEGPGPRFLREVSRLAEAAVNRSALRLMSAFPTTAAAVRQELSQDILARMGVHAVVTLKNPGAHGRRSLGPLQMVIDLADQLATPVSVKVELDDDQNRLPPPGGRDGAAEEEALVRQVVLAALSERARLQELVTAMPRIEGRITEDLKLALAPHARRILRCELSLQMEVPRKAVNLQATRLIVVGARRYNLEATTYATPRDAVLLTRAPIADIASWWGDRLQHHGEDVLPQHDHATLLLGFDPISDVISARLRADLERHGYETGRVRALVLDRAPRLPSPLPVSAKMSIGAGLGDQPLAVTLLASIECHDRKVWINKGEPDLTQVITTCVREWMEGKLRTEDRVVALRQFESHRQEVVQAAQTELAAVGARLATRPDQSPAFRLEPTDDAQVLDRVAFEHAMTLKYDGGARTADLSFTGLAKLMADGRWVYLAAPVPMQQWLTVRTREIIEDVFRAATRESAVDGFDALMNRVSAQLAQELPLTGYALSELAVRAPALRVTAPGAMDVPFSAETRLAKLNDTVTIRGVLEIALVDRAAWLRAGEPEIGDWATRHARLVFERVMRAATPSQVDTAPDALRTRVETGLRPLLQEAGYLLRSMPSQITAEPAQPQAFEEIVTPIRLHMRHREREVKAVVQMKLQSLAVWRDSGVRDVRQWAIDQINAITKTRLFKESYTSLLEEAEGHERPDSASGKSPFTVIEQEMNQSARAIGYVVSKVMTLDEGDAIALLQGFPLHVHGDYTTALHHHAFNIHIRGQARALRLDDIRSLLDRDVPIIERAHEAIHTRLQAHIAQLNPNDLAFRFTANETESAAQGPGLQTQGVRSPRQVMLAAVSDVLGKMGLVGEDLSVQIELPELFKRVQPLRGQLLRMRLSLAPRDHRIALAYTVQARIDDLSPVGQDLDLAHLPSVMELQADLERYLTAELTEWGAGDLVVRSADQHEQLKRAVDGLIRKYSYSQMKVNIVLSSLVREATFADGKYERNLREIEEAWAYFEERRKELRGQVLELTRRGELQGAEEVQRKLVEFEAGQRPPSRPTTIALSGGPDGKPAQLEDNPPLSPVSVQIPAPLSGYACADLDQRIYIDAKVFCSLQTPDSEPSVVRAVRSAIQSILNNIYSVDFYLGFHRHFRGRHIMSELDQAVQEALLGPVADARGPCELSFSTSPDPRLADLRDRCRGQRFQVRGELNRGQAERDAMLEVDIEVEDVAMDGLTRFQALLSEEGGPRAVATKVVQRTAKGLSVGAPSLLDNEELSARLRDALVQELGMEVRLTGVRVQQQLTEAERKRLARLTSDINDAEARRDRIEAGPAECDPEGAMAQISEQIAVLKRQRADLLSRGA